MPRRRTQAKHAVCKPRPSARGPGHRLAGLATAQSPSRASVPCCAALGSPATAVWSRCGAKRWVRPSSRSSPGRRSCRRSPTSSARGAVSRPLLASAWSELSAVRPRRLRALQRAPRKRTLLTRRAYLLAAKQTASYSSHSELCFSAVVRASQWMQERTLAAFCTAKHPSGRRIRATRSSRRRISSRRWAPRGGECRRWPPRERSAPGHLWPARAAVRCW
mmetsp:Transcript_126485/g.352424  ORF Transcript_126485/g.352424 Transcript_126485/m.352424 type:complete len:220 (-) Transcript_126485:52-711(-)